VDWLSFVQWPAMAATIIAAWFVASRHKHGRIIGFWVFVVSNVLWIVWGWHDGAHALIVLQFALAALNIRGVLKNEEPAPGHAQRAAQPARD